MTIERGADEFRVYCRSWTVERTTTSTRIDVLTGDQRTNLYRAFFGKRYNHGEMLQVGGQSYGTSSDPAVGGGNELALFATTRLGEQGLERRRLSTCTPGARAICASRISGTRCSSRRIPRQERTRADMYLRAGHGTPDSGVWVQAMVAHSNFTENSPFSSDRRPARRFRGHDAHEHAVHRHGRTSRGGGCD